MNTKNRIASNILECIGSTPIIHLQKIEKNFQLPFRLYAKWEGANPGGSVKDRIAYQMIRAGFQTGKINQETTLIEPTSGNTGIGLAMVGAYYDLKTIILMPSNMSKERIALMESYGAKVELTPPEEGMEGAVKRAFERKDKIPNSFIPSQFENLQNPYAHEISTALEIETNIDLKECAAIIAGIGTGGTLSGLAHALQPKYPHVQFIGVEPKESPLLSEGRTGKHGIQGIGANFIPVALDQKCVHSLITVSTHEALEGAKYLRQQEAIFCGISSGAALQGALKLKENPFYRGKSILIILPDQGNRYLSTPEFL